MAVNTKGSKTDGNGWRVEQYYNPATDSYEVVEGNGGAVNTKLIGSKIQPLAITLPYTVAAGANVSLVGILDVTNYRRVVAAVSLDVSKAGQINIRERAKGGNPIFDNLVSGTSTKHLQNTQPRLSNVDVYFSNTDTTSVNITNAEIMTWISA
jgi:hypothetical protein